MKPLDSAWWRYSLEHKYASISIQFENLIKSRIIILLSISGSVCVKLFYVSFHGAAVAKVLPTDVASECLYARVLHQVTRHTVRRCKPATAYITVIGIETLVHLHMPSEACPVGESLSTLTTLMSQITRHWQLVLIHPLAYDATAWNTIRHRLGIYRLRFGTLNRSIQSSPSPRNSWHVLSRC